MLYHYQQLVTFAEKVFIQAGLNKIKARAVAETLTEGDLLGHRTHGLQLLEAYLNEIENGGMQTRGQPSVTHKKRAVEAWDGRYLPGPWLVKKAIHAAIKKAKTYGIATITIQKCHHIGCLAAYMEAVTDQHLILQLMCSDPRNRTVAPFGGTTPVYSPNPIAVGIPTSTEPIIIDVSMSATSNALIAQKHQAHEKLPYPWLLDAQGKVTDDPAAFFAHPPASIMPLGGLDTGYKGFGLGIMVEAMTNALGGFGRSQHPTNWGASVCLHLTDPSILGNLQSFLTEMDFLKQECLNSASIDAAAPIRMPGSKALALKKRQMADGLDLNAQTLASLGRVALRYNCASI